MAAPSAPSRDFFVSYTGIDETWATWIANTLEDHGYTTVIQAWDFAAGSNFVLRMHEAARTTQRTILVLSPDALYADFTAPEWAAALAQDPRGHDSRLIPVRVRDCEPDGLLRAIRYIDLVGLDESAAVKKLVAEVTVATTPGTRGTHAGAVFPGAAVVSQTRFPAGLPAVWNVPFRTLTFVGREQMLADMRARLDERSGAAVSRPEAIHGLGGIGKTRLCVEYAHRNAEAFDVVWWVRAGTPVTLVGDLAQLAKRLALPEARDADQMVAALAVKRWLDRNPRWLVVFDNAPGPGDVRDWVPAAGHGQTLITSRWSAGWGATALSVEVSVLDRDESVELLSASAPDSDRASAEDLAGLLGDLPLALAQAAAYVQATSISLADYVKRYRAHAATMGSLGRLGDYEATVATTWSLAMEQLESDQAARALMSTTAFLASEQIPRALFTESEFVMSVFATEERLLAVDAAVEALRRFSIIDASGEGIEMHRLVQAVIRERLSLDEAKNWNGAAQAVLAGLFPSEVQVPEIWRRCDSLLPHGLIVGDWAAEHGNETAGTAALLYALGRYQAWRLELRSAEALFRGAMRIAERVDMDAGDSAAIKAELAQVLAEAGEDAEATILISDALNAIQDRFGADSLATASLLRNKGSILRRTGDLDGALRDLGRALEIAEVELAADDPELVGFLVNLANAEPPATARVLHERAVAIAEGQPQVDPHLLAVSLTNLGNTHHRLGNLELAGNYLRRAVTIYEEAYGPDFPRIAGLLASLGVALREQNHLDEAENALRRAIQIEEKTLGADHMEVATTLIDLADLLQHTDIAEAERMAARAVDIARSSGDPPGNLPNPLARLGDIQRQRGAPYEAETTMREALQLVVDRHGERSPESAHIRVKLGAILRSQNRAAEAVDELNLAVELLEGTGDIYQLAAAMNNLGNALGDIGRNGEAAASLECCASLTKELFGDRHPRYASALINLAITYRQIGDEGRVSELVEQAIDINPNCVQWD